MLVVPSDTEGAAIVVYPDSAGSAELAALSFILLSANGDTIARRVAARGTDSVECGNAPLVRLGKHDAADWSLGLTADARAPLRLDSIETLPAVDSARLVANLARLASGLPGAAESRFTGLPFAVLTARRFSIEGRTHVAANLIRRLPQEAAPLEERTLLIAERVNATDSALALAFSQRSEGSEETAAHFDVLAVVQIPGSTLLLLARDQLANTDFQLLERKAAGPWRIRWSRPLHC